jgi:PKD repeat protein
MAEVDLSGISHEGPTTSEVILYTNRESLMKGTYSNGTISNVTGVNSYNQPSGSGIHLGYSQYFTKETVGGDLNLWRFEAPRDGTFSFYAGQSILRWSNATTEDVGSNLGNWNSQNTGNDAGHTASVTMTTGQYVYFNCANTEWTYDNSNTGGAGIIMIMYTANTAPTSFFLAQSEGLVGKITDLSSDSDGTIVRWKFDFGTAGSGQYIGADPTDLTNTTSISRYLIFDATDSASVANTPPATFYYRFNTASNKTISLEVTDDTGATHSSSLEDPGYITVENLDPSAGFTFLTYRDNKELDVGDLSDDLDGVIVEWEWDWGDGNTDTWTTATRPTNGEYTHTYALNGTYDVTLTVTDDVDGTNAQTVTVDVPRTTASIIFSQSGPISMGFSVLAGVSSVNPENDQYRGPSFLAWSRTVDVQNGRNDATEIAAHDDVFNSIIPVDPLPAGYTQAQVDAYGYPRDPLSLKDLTVEGASTYEVDYLAPSDAVEPYGMGEWLGAEIPQPGVASPEPPDVAIGSNGLYSVAFDNETYFKIFVDTSGSMNNYVGAYHTAAANVAAEMTDVFFGGDAAVARKYVLPSQNISNERWAQWAMTTLYQPGEPQKQVIIAAINEDDSGPGGTNAAIQAKAQAMFDNGGHYYFIMVQPPGGGWGPMMSMGPALAQTRVTVGTGPNQEQLRWAQFAYETANGGALTNVIKQILGFLPA